MKRILDNRIASEAAGYFEELEEGIEPDHDEAEDEAAELMYTLVYETVGRFKRRKVIKRVGRRLVYYIDEYIKAECIPERRAALFELIAKELSRQTDTTQFKLLNGEYIKGLLGEHIRTLPPEPAQPEQAPADDTEEPTEPLEASEDTAPEEEPEDESEAGEQLDLSEFEEAEAAELAKQAATPEQSEKAAEEVAEEPVQEQIELPPVAVAGSGEPVQELIPKPVNEPAEPVTADVGNVNEEQ